MLRTGLIGFGYWGHILARNFHSVPSSILAGVCDSDPARVAEAGNLYPEARTVTDAKALIGDPKLDAIVIATPPASHFPLAMAALEAGKHVWVEKPLGSSSVAAGQLQAEAHRRRRVLMVDYTFVYSAPVRKIRELMDSGELGTLFYHDSVRVNRGRIQGDVNVLWDLASHDLAILDYLLDEPPLRTRAHGVAHLGKQLEVAYLSLDYASGFHAHIHVSWLAPVKIRLVTLAASKQTLLWNDLDSAHKVQVYSQEGQRTHAPALEVTEPLENAVRHFLTCIETGARPCTDGEMAIRVARILEQAVDMRAIDSA
jgi:predicted dehydrogenase